MRIERLDLTRFGGFTDRSLDLSGDGVHVIVGANETGKTTAMAAIRQLLYGIPIQSPHDYLHSYQDMRIGARLRLAGGDAREIVRLKRNSNALRDPSDAPIDESTLASWLYDVDQSLYASLFEISHQEIASGGDALLESDGDLGRAVFSASRGTTDLNAVLRKLDERADGLYKRAGQNPTLNAAIREYKVRLERANALSVNVREVTDLDAQLQQARSVRAALARERNALLARRELLERIKAARPQLAERQERIVTCDRLAGEGPLVETHVAAELVGARDKRRAARERAAAAAEAIDRVALQLAQLEVDSDLLAQREVIARLQAATGAYRQNLDDLPRRRGVLHDADVELSRLRERLPPSCRRDPAGVPALGADEHVRIVELSDAFPRRDEQLTQATEQVAHTTRALAALRMEGAARPAPTEHRALDDALARVRLHGDLEGGHAAATKQLADLEGRLVAAMARLGIDGADRRALDAVPVPAAESVREHRTALEAAGFAVGRIREQLEGLNVERTALAGELDALLRDAHPPSDDDLAAARAAREHGWALVCEIWRDGADPGLAAGWASGVPLDAAYPASVRRADQVADRLRQDASSVERRSSLETRIVTADGRIATERARLAEATAHLGRLEGAWRALWVPVGIAPDAPAAMERWRDEFWNAANDSRLARECASTIAGIEDAIAECQRELGALCAGIGAPVPQGLSLAGAVDHVERLARDAADARTRDAELAAAVSEAETQLQAHTQALSGRTRAIEEWRAAWGDAVAVIGLGATAAPAEARAVLDVITGIGAQRRIRDDAISRITGIEQRNDAFVRGVAAIIAALPAHQDLAARAPEIAVATLVDRREAAQDVATAHGTLTQQRTGHAEDLELAGGAVRDADGRIAEVMTRSGVGDESALDAAIVRSRTHADAVERIETIEHALRQAFGRTIDALVTEVEAMGDQEIDPLLAMLATDLEQANAQFETESAGVGELTNRRAQITASGDAAEAIEGAQQSLADVADAAEHYVQTVLAKRLLEEQIGAFRAAHQGPLMLRANVLFSALTLGRYAGLDTDTNPKGDPILRARATNGRVLDVATLSTGTRDQLYLALRLAALEGLIARRGPLPLVLDDLFVHFDDDRTDAGLRVLEQISEQTQVLLFTHHQRVAEQALSAIAAGSVHVAQLAPITP